MYFVELVSIFLLSATFDYGICVEYEVDTQYPMTECISLQKCPVYDEIAKNKGRNWFQILRKVQCGFDDKIPKVLCPLPESTTLENPSTDSINNEYEINDCRTSLEKDGKCINVENCPLFTDLIKSIDRRVILYVFSLIQETYCGFDGYIPKVCCDISEDISKEPTVNFYERFDDFTEPEKNDLSPLLNNKVTSKLDLLPKKCGIYKVDQTEHKDDLKFPWLASILYDSDTRKCEGSIIDHRHVLTSAQCVIDNENSCMIGIRIQNYDKGFECMLHNHPDNCLPYKNMPISKVMVHPDFDISRLSNDIAIVKLENNINFEKHFISPICLPTSVNSLEKPTKIFNLTALNWKIKESDLELDETSIPIVDESICKDFYKRVFNISIDHRQICTGNIGLKNLYKVDSGGPLQHLEDINGNMVYVQYGIGNFCLEKDALGVPGIHTRVSQYMDWILENLEK